MALSAILAVAPAACGDELATRRDADVDADAAIDAAGDADVDADLDGDAEIDGDLEGEARDGDPDGDAEDGGSPLAVTTEVVTREHRFVPGAMFGGWGPHLGHLLRTDRAGSGETDLYWVDDLCSQDVAGDCDVHVNRRVGVFRRESDGWRSVATVLLPAGVQQNTATLAAGTTLRVFGMDTSAARVAECAIDVTSGASACAPISIAVGPSANYIGAAVAPTGSRVVWWTNVVDGGGGSFSYIADCGGGWNGPRAGPVGGYNNCAYAHAAFRADGPEVTFFCQVVSGLAPDWTPATHVGEASLVTTDPVVWANVLAPSEGDPVVSTNDLWIDGSTGDAHLLARTEGGAAAYYFRPRDGAWTGALFVAPGSYRARWTATTDRVALVSGPSTGGLELRLVPRDAMVAGDPLDFTSAPPLEVALPEGFGSAVGIYPVSDVYQTAEVTGLELVVVGQRRQNEALFVEVDVEP